MDRFGNLLKKAFKRKDYSLVVPSPRGPPAYEDSEIYAEIVEPQQEEKQFNSIDSLDLLETCKRVNSLDINEETSVSETMGLKFSSPIACKNRSKISLTWVLKEQSHSNSTNPRERRMFYEDFTLNERNVLNDVWYDDYWQHGSDFSSNTKNTRIIGRNEVYSCEINSCKNDSIYNRSRTKRRHRRRRRTHTRKSDLEFGYEINDIDYFLTEASIDKPGNIPVVLTCPSVLYQTGSGRQNEKGLPLGTVVNAVFKKNQWLYVQTPHGDEGYVLYTACLALGILPERERTKSNLDRLPCWESSMDIYPKPCGNMTDSEKTRINSKSRSECGYKINKPEYRIKQAKSLCNEETFDNLYMKATSLNRLNSYTSDLNNGYVSLAPRRVERHTLLVINYDYIGSKISKTISVRKGDVVILIEGKENDVDNEWFYVRKKNGCEGFIPAEIAGHGYI